MAQRRFLPLLIASALFAVVCARLGVWQLHRLSERRAFNDGLEKRLAAAAVEVGRLSADTAIGHYHRVVAAGRFDYGAQVVLASRSSQGSPGVHLLTPLRLADGRVVMVNRGWVYASDAMTVDPARWRDRDTVSIRGYAETWSGHERAPLPPDVRVVRALDSSAVARRVGVPILPYYIVQTSDSAPARDAPVRLGEPVLDDGSHRSYAIQWFSFALVALIGGALVLRDELATRRASA